MTEPRPLGMKRIPQFTGRETLKEAAHMWAEAGAAVIPLGRNTKSPGSILGKGWPHRATNDPETIERWFSRADVGGVAIETGRSGVVVIDVDQNVIGVDGGVVEHTRGLDSLRAHRYFLMPEDKKIGNSRNALKDFKGDVRGFGGCVAVYPTPHPEGGQYIFRDSAIGAEIPPLPADLKEALSEVGSVSADPMTYADALKALDADGLVVPDTYQRDQYILRYENRVNGGESRHDSCWKTMCNLFRDLMKGRVGRHEYDAVVDHIFDSMTRQLGGDRKTYSDEAALADIQRCTADAYAQALATWAAEHDALEEAAAQDAADGMFGPWQIRDEEELNEMEFPPALVEDSLVPVGIGQVIGDSMAGKTFVVLDLAFRIADGRDWFGHKVNTPGDVVYVYKEGAKSVKARAAAWRMKYGHVTDAPGRVHFIAGEGLFSDPKDIMSLEKGLQARGITPRLILGDTQALLFDTHDENDNAEAAKNARLLKEWSQRAGCLILLLHHTVKDGTVARGGRGAGGWKGNSDCLITVAPASVDEDGTASDLRTVKVTKYKDGAPWEMRECFSIEQVGPTPAHAVLVRQDRRELGMNSSNQLSEAESHSRYLEAVSRLGAEATVGGVAQDVGVSKQAASKVLSKLAEQGLITRPAVGPGKSAPYDLTPEGREALARSAS